MYIEKGTSTTLETVSGTGAGVAFLFPYHSDGVFNVIFQAKSGTTISADLQVSEDGGQTFTNYIPTLITAAGVKAVSGSGSTPLVAGPLFRFNYTTATGTWTILISTN